MLAAGHRLGLGAILLLPHPLSLVGCPRNLGQGYTWFARFFLYIGPAAMAEISERPFLPSSGDVSAA